jgi:hypothetical protein
MKPTEHMSLVLSFAIVLVSTTATGSVYADIVSTTEDAAKFGHLDQGATTCPAMGCGATAAVNSFVYLQNAFPDVFTTPLVPKAGTTLTQDDMVKVANDLAQRMGTGPSGTSIESFILGKMDYIESQDKGRTTYAAQLALAWNSTAPKPGFVTDNTPPTLSFIAREIKAGEDVEAFLAGPAGRHFITLTGISYDDQNNTGTVSFIDPLGGKDTTADITGLDSANLIHIKYKLEGELQEFAIGNVVAESVPEPSTLLLVTSACAALAVWRGCRKQQ